MRWTETIDLVTETYVTDNEGISSPVTTVKTVYANAKYVRQSEFYNAAANGLRPSRMFEIRANEYNDAVKVLFDGKYYKVIRVYSKNGEVMELVCEGEVLDGG